MKKASVWFLIVAVLAGLTFMVVRVTPNWEGVDDTVVGRYAEQAGRPPRKAYIDTDRGDMLLFFFLIAGVVGGFIGGYSYRELFPPEEKKEDSRENRIVSNEHGLPSSRLTR